jgi:hypothetical protein
LTTLYRSTDRLCRGGAAVKNLAQSASLHAGENNAPSKPGTKQLEKVPNRDEPSHPGLQPQANTIFGLGPLMEAIRT